MDNPKGRGLTARAWWPWARRIVTLLFFSLVGWLLVKQARNIDWAQVWTAAGNHPLPALLLAAGLGIASHGLYSSFDLLGRHYTGHRLPTWQVMLTTFISYAFNLNLGSLVGGVAFRFRLYSRLGLDNARIGRILGISMLTNWLGYLVLAGAVFASGLLEVPAEWRIAGPPLQWLGGALLLVAAGYVVACFASKRRLLVVRGHELPLPTGRMALLQLAMSCTNWMLMGAMVWTLLDQRIGYATVLGVLLIAAIAGVITHVPAGLGVLEAVFVALLSDRIPAGELLASLLIYRAMYYLVPLALATLLHLTIEARALKAKARQPRPPRPPRPAPARPASRAPLH
ncbi:MAG: UPF0104 family protein [Aquincola sp.]|nr:UPF0104 family protein [Aquincola sp.]